MERQLYQQGLAAAKNGNLSQAIQEFTAAIEINPQFAAAYYRRGLASYDLGNLEKAIADYNQSLNLDSQQVEVYFARALAFLATNNLQASKIDLQVILKLDPNYAQAYELYANLSLRQQEIEQAIAYLKTAGKIYLNRQDKVNCRRCIAKIRTLEQQQIKAKGGITNEAFLAKIRQQMRLGEFTAALNDCNWLLKTDPYNPEAYHCRGNINMQLGNNQQAKTDFTRAAQYFRSQGKSDEAEKMERLCLQLRLADTISPASISPHISLPPVANHPPSPQFPRTPHPENAIQTRLYMLVGDWNVAQNLVEQVKRIYPGMPETWYWEKVINDLEGDRDSF